MINVHHKFYIQTRMAWQYENEALTSLCSTCHQEEHKKNRTPIYNENMELQMYAKVCPKCSGSDVLKEFKYFKNGICFECMGTGNVNPLPSV